MARYVLRYVGQGCKPAQVVDRLRTHAEATILDETPRMLLVEATEDAIRPLQVDPEHWLVVPEQQVPLPDVRPKSKRGG